MKDHLSLSEAIKLNKLPVFIAQQQSLAHGKVDRAEFDRVVKSAVKELLSQDRTSGSRVRGGSSEKKTR